jgi:hypothetical protein
MAAVRGVRTHRTPGALSDFDERFVTDDALELMFTASGNRLTNQRLQSLQFESV